MVVCDLLANSMYYTESRCGKHYELVVFMTRTDQVKAAIPDRVFLLNPMSEREETC